MDLLIIIIALAALITVAYRGYSVIIFAPIVALAAVLFFEPLAILPAYTNLFMQRTSEFVRNFFPLFMLGAIFGKVVEMSGFAKSITLAIFKMVGPKNAILTIVLVAAILSYGGVSAHVIVFSVYPFAAEMFKLAVIPKRLIPGAIWLGGITFTMDCFPGSPQIQNIIPTSFFKTDAYAAPILGIVGGLFVFVLGLLYFMHLQKKAAAKGETYSSGVELLQEPAPFDPSQKLPPWQIAIIPLVLVGVVNYLMTKYGVPALFGEQYSLSFPGLKAPIVVSVAAMRGLWAVEIAMVAAILCTILLAPKAVIKGFTDGMKQAMAAALLAIMNTASEYGYGSIIAALPGFLFLVEFFKHVSGDPLVAEAITVNVLAGIVGSASGGISIAMGAMSDMFIQMANEANIPLEVAHRVASMASGGMDSLPHNGAVITAMFVTGLTHRQAYMPILATTVIKTVAVPVVIALYYITGLY
ncbi:MAG: GntP family permease [Desulfovibrio sp.]|jgi:H+/gluconate symporter-like permease|nr:GntP family permease [Desulfovibrio sp.]